jgi:hypothetical protein
MFYDRQRSKAIQIRHGDIEKHDIGFLPQCFAYRFPTGRHHRYHRNPRVFQHQAECIRNMPLVIRNKNTYAFPLGHFGSLSPCIRPSKQDEIILARQSDELDMMNPYLLSYG